MKIKINGKLMNDYEKRTKLFFNVARIGLNGALLKATYDVYKGDMIPFLLAKFGLVIGLAKIILPPVIVFSLLNAILNRFSDMALKHEEVK